MADLRDAIADVPDFPRPGVLFRDISPLLRDHLSATVQALDALLTDEEWNAIDALAGIESRGFILGSALALERRKGFVLVRKQGKLPPPVVSAAYALEYGNAVLEVQAGGGRLRSRYGVIRHRSQKPSGGHRDSGASRHGLKKVATLHESSPAHCW